jgi:hypothetical protein
MKRRVMLGLLALSSVPLPAQKGYGARNPVTCPSRKEPARGGPSAAQAIKYFTCDNEYIQDWSYRHELHLVSDVKAEVGAGRRFDIVADHPPSNEGINPAELVYPIKGSFVSWTCGPVEASEADRNCMKYSQQGATGSCYKTISGDWHCRMIGRGAFVAGQPPPK